MPRFRPWVLLLLLLPAIGQANEERIPFPVELQKDVHFWVRVYSEVTTSEGFLHDEDDLGIVYRKLRFAKDVTTSQRRKAVDAARDDIQAMLKRLAAGAQDLTDEEQKIAAAFGEGTKRARFAEAAKHVRFQLGQADRFREGLERSAIWESHITETFADLGLPAELAMLPHVESSFDPTAWSKVGAAGLWQFMRGTGRRFMRIDDAVDERMDPFRATEAAAQLLDYNYRMLGSWPLAITAYNHGSEGMRRARESMGTTDIATIVRRYSSRSFGFASRNFYVSFLAALTIARDPDAFFADLKRRPEMLFTEVEVPAYVPVAALEKAMKLDRNQLQALNPALSDAVWEGVLYVPRGYRLRLPPEGAMSTSLLAQAIAPADQFATQPRPRTHRVRSGETLSGIASRYGVSVATLARINGMRVNDVLRASANLRLPEAPARPASVARPVALDAAGEVEEG